jgi:hypothetical protein
VANEIKLHGLLTHEIGCTSQEGDREYTLAHLLRSPQAIASNATNTALKKRACAPSGKPTAGTGNTECIGVLHEASADGDGSAKHYAQRSA